MKDKNKPIGVFDSGVGGISVLKKVVQQLLHENFIYYGDSLNAPYGSKPLEEVRRLTMDGVEFLLEHNVKAIVVACNTATSAAINEIRTRYPEIPIIGTEPALKPAVLASEEGSIVVMATERTLSEEKFARLMDTVARERDVIKMPCPGLAELIEDGKAETEEARDYLREKFSAVDLDKVSSVVLGCTHYPFIRDALTEVIGEDKLILDGAEGISRHLHHVLMQRGLLTDRKRPGEVQIINSASGDEMLNLSVQLLISGCGGETAEDDLICVTG